MKWVCDILLYVLKVVTAMHMSCFDVPKQRRPKYDQIQEGNWHQVPRIKQRDRTK